MTLRALGRFVTCGTFAALGNSKILASNIETPIRQSFGINLGMIGICDSDLAFWLDIHTNVVVRTNDFKEIDLGIGTSAYHYFGLASPPLPKRARPIPEDFRPQAREVIKLRGVGMADSNGMTHERITLRDLGQLPHERAITIDENENVVICGRDGILLGAAKDSARFTDVPSSSSHGLDSGTISLYLSILEPGTWEYFPRGTLFVSEFRIVALGRSGLTGGELFNSSWLM
jgi:hypothetical protein